MMSSESCLDAATTNSSEKLVNEDYDELGSGEECLDQGEACLENLDRW